MQAMKVRSRTLVALAVIAALAVGAQATALATITDDINPQDFARVSYFRNTAMVTVENPGTTEISVTVIGELVVKGVTHTASTVVTLGGGQSAVAGLVFSIVDDINPQMLSAIVAIIDDSNPMGK
jgi:hypothetical protein